MAVGDDAIAEGFSVVADTDKVRFGGREITLTRDYIAQVKRLILAIWPVSRGGTGATNKASARSNLGITSGTAAPSGGASGDIYFKIV